MRFERARYIPKNSAPVEHPEGLGVAYIYPMNSGSAVIAYKGKATRSSFHVSYKTTERANLAITEWFSSLTGHVEFVRKMRVERSAPTTLVPGDIIVNSWGYEQTNVYWYRVIRASAHFVWLQRIGGNIVEGAGGPMSGRSMPDLEAVSTAPIERHGSSKNHVTFKFGSGSKWDGRSMYCSWYA